MNFQTNDTHHSPIIPFSSFTVPVFFFLPISLFSVCTFIDLPAASIYIFIADAYLSTLFIFDFSFLLIYL